MAIVGIGTDIVEIERMEAVVSRTGAKIARRILSPNELLQYQQHNKPVRFLAKRFAVKEAVSKAFGTGIRNGLTFSQVEVCNDALGKPSLQLIAQAAELASRLKITRMHVTLADERCYVYAMVIFEK